MYNTNSTTYYTWVSAKETFWLQRPWQCLETPDKFIASPGIYLQNPAQWGEFINPSYRFKPQLPGESLTKKNVIDLKVASGTYRTTLAYPTGSMVLLYIWQHGSHQYTPVILAFFYQHHGSVEAGCCRTHFGMVRHRHHWGPQP